MSDKLQRIHADISESLNEIAALFDPKHTPMITLIVRTPWLEDGDVLMGNDDYDKAIAAINRLRPTAEIETDPADKMKRKV